MVDIDVVDIQLVVIFILDILEVNVDIFFGIFFQWKCYSCYIYGWNMQRVGNCKNSCIGFFIVCGNFYFKVVYICEYCWFCICEIFNVLVIKVEGVISFYGLQDWYF